MLIAYRDLLFLYKLNLMRFGERNFYPINRLKIKFLLVTSFKVKHPMNRINCYQKLYLLE